MLGGPAITVWRRPARANVFAGLVLLGAAFLFHFPAWSSGLIPMEDDVRVFYYPLLVATSNALKHGALVLWTPSIFGGYPLFADGEAGMLYPLHLLIYPFLTPEASLVVLRILHSFLASLFTYMFVRTLGGRPASGVIAGLVYAYSGFTAGQIVHTNMFQSMVWLPLELALAERACVRQGWARYRYAALAGAVVGIQTLTLHIHVTLISAVALSLFLGYRGLTLGFERDARLDDPPPQPFPARGEGDGPLASTGGEGAVSRGAHGLLRGVRSFAFGAVGAASILAVIGIVGIALSAVQLLPLYELAAQTSRGSGLSEARAQTNSIWSGGFITMLLPRFYDTPAGGFWEPWVKWETTAYVGLLPLLLAGIAVLTRTGRHLLFFVILGGLAVLLALGASAPVHIWDALHSLPGFESLQSPGRFTLLLSLAVAVLAAYGADWLAGQQGLERSRRRAWRAVLVLIDGGLSVLVLGLELDHLSTVARTSAADHLPLLDYFLSLPGMPAKVDGAPLTPAVVAQLAANNLRPENPAVLAQLYLAAAAFVVVALWLLGGALRPGRLGRAAAGMAVGLIAVDLLGVFLSFHQYGRIADLRPRLPDVLVQHADQPFRVYTPPTADEKRTQVEPDRLLAAGVEAADGYSSLEPDRHAMYVGAIEYSDTQLLDLWNARFIVHRQKPQSFPSYAGVVFVPQRPLVSGLGAAADETLTPEGGAMRASSVRVIARLTSAADVTNGTTVATVRLEGTDGATRELPVQAGRDVSDSGLDVPGTTQTFKHGRATVAFQYQTSDPNGDNFGQQLYFADLPINPPMTVSRVTVHLAGVASVEVFGLGLIDPATQEVTQVRDKARYRPVYQDQQIQVFENTDVMPRAFLVENTVVVPRGANPLPSMRDGTIDLRRTAVLECPDGGGCGPAAFPHADAPPRYDQVGPARIVSRSGRGMVIHATASAPAMLVLSDPFFPGWVARVDGRPTPIIRTDALFRGIVVPPGDHTVSFSYEPTPLAVGAASTIAMGFLLILFFAVPLADRARRHVWAATRRRGLATRQRRPALAAPPIQARS